MGAGAGYLCHYSFLLTDMSIGYTLLLSWIRGNHVIRVIVDKLAPWPHVWLVGTPPSLFPLPGIVLWVGVVIDGAFIVGGLGLLREARDEGIPMTVVSMRYQSPTDAASATYFVTISAPPPSSP